MTVLQRLAGRSAKVERNSAPSPRLWLSPTPHLDQDLPRDCGSSNERLFLTRMGPLLQPSSSHSPHSPHCTPCLSLPSSPCGSTPSFHEFSLCAKTSGYPPLSSSTLTSCSSSCGSSEKLLPMTGVEIVKVLLTMCPAHRNRGRAAYLPL